MELVSFQSASYCCGFLGQASWCGTGPICINVPYECQYHSLKFSAILTPHWVLHNLCRRYSNTNPFLASEPPEPKRHDLSLKEEETNEMHKLTFH